MNKKLFYAVVTLIFMVSVVLSVTISAQADIQFAAEASTDDNSENEIGNTGIIASGNCVNGNKGRYSWKIYDNGLLTISGKGEMESYFNVAANVDKRDWHKYRDLIKSVIIEDGITAVGISAFCELVNLETVRLADTVKIINPYAFLNCTSLKDISMENSVEIIYGAAFSSCTSLEWICIPNAVTSIYIDTFSECTSLKTISIPESVVNISEGAFKNAGLEKIVINNPECVIEYNADTIPVDAVIYGHVNSPAQMYAQLYGRDFVTLSAGECEHTYSEWVIDADATCTQRGFAHRVCTLCNGYEFDVIDETGHIDDDADNICDVCDEVLSSQTPDTDDGGESGDNNSLGGISSFFASIKELFNRIISWFRTIFGMV